ncbi:MAG: DNA-binding protein [Bacteroidota bacterium]
MNITFEELRNIKHSLPTGSVKRIANELRIEEQTVRNYFGAKDYTAGKSTGWHLQPGPNGGLLSFKDTTILDLAKQIIHNQEVSSTEN